MLSEAAHGRGRRVNSTFISDRTLKDFIQDDLLRSAVLDKLTVIGEAAARLSAELRARHTRVEWADIVAFRNFAVHAHFAVGWRWSGSPRRGTRRNSGFRCWTYSPGKVSSRR